MCVWVGVSIKSICVEVDLHNVLITSEPQDNRRVTTNERGFLVRSVIYVCVVCLV